MEKGLRRITSLLLGVAVVASAVMSLSSPAPATPKRWVPTAKDRWVYEIGRADPRLGLCATPWSASRCVRPTVWVLDLYAVNGTSPNVTNVIAIHHNFGHAVCYLSAGSFEAWRPDAAAFPDSVIGLALDGWPGERWIDIRQRSVLRPILEARADRCARAGFDAIDWDNVDGHTQETGFPLSADDQLAYNRMLASIARARGMSVGLKNDLVQIPALVGSFDFAVNEQCAQFNECDLLLPFSTSGKAVVQIEYSVKPDVFCGQANKRRWSALLANRKLDGSLWKPCR